MVSPSSIQPLTKPAISASESGVNTTNGYSTRQSVASVTWLTRLRPSNLMLSLAVSFPSVFSVFLRNAVAFKKIASKVLIAPAAIDISSPTRASRVTSTAGVRRFSTSDNLCRKASTSCWRRFGLSSKSSCKYGLRCTTQISPKASYSMRAERPVLRSSRNWFKIVQARSPKIRCTISRSENEV